MRLTPSPPCRTYNKKMRTFNGNKEVSKMLKYQVQAVSRLCDVLVGQQFTAQYFAEE